MKRPGSRRARLAAAGAMLAAVVLAPAGAAGAGLDDLLALVDDRGEPLGAPVELCFVRGLTTDCVDQAADDGPVELPAFDLLRVEGPDHGPVTARPGDLRPAGEGGPRLMVPRKATLRVGGASGHRLTAALYPGADLDPARPAHSLAVPADGELKVPAGDWVLALEARGAAPDLHPLAAAPGSGHDVRYRPRAGWSLALRAVSKDDREPVPAAEVQVRAPETPGEQDPETAGEPPRAATTGDLGLALVSGLEAPLLEAVVRHPDFVDATAPALAAAPGALELREIALGRGATLEATLRVDGEPAADWRCALLDRAPPAAESSRVVREMAAGSEGVCRGEKLPEGRFWLRVSPPDATGAAETEVQLYDGEAAAVDLDLSAIRVAGEVLRGQEPLAGQTIRVFRVREIGSTQLIEPVAEAMSAEDGTYETTVWAPGSHSLHLVDSGGKPAASERADVQAPVTRVDFHLAPGDIEGIVVDEAGEPLAGATVMVRWDAPGESSARGLRTAEDGVFLVPREAATGTLTVTASHSGFQPESVRLELVEDAVPPALVLTLRRGGLLRGRVVTADGAAVVGAMVTSFGGWPGPMSNRLGSTRTDAEGGFEVLPAEGSPTRLFATGPGCPLTAADVAPGEAEPVLLACSGSAGTLVLHLRDGQSRPVSGERVLLRRGDLVIPFHVMFGHLHLLGQSVTSDGSGRLVVPGLPPGAYEVYLARDASEPSVAQGLPQGYAGSVALAPGQTAELEVRVESPP